MKKLMMLLVISTLLAACGEEEAEPANEPEEHTETAAEPAEEEQEQAEEPEEEKTPEDQIKEAVEETGAEIESFNGQFVQSPYSMQLELKGTENLTTNTTVKGFKMDMKDVLYAIKESGVDPAEIANVGISVKYPLVDQYGNSSDEYVIKSDFSGETISKLAEKKSAFDFDNLPNIADSWWEHQAIQQ